LAAVTEEMPAMALTDDRWCFACGPDNPHGLHLAFRFEGDDYVCDFVPQRCHQGWAGVVHGGIIATLLDEAMTRMLWDTGTNAVTADLHLRLSRPAQVGIPLQVRARVRNRRKSLVEAEAEALLSDGTVVATAQSKLLMEEPG
jgi:uncharacterized protein (TIGR00369 family)